MARIKGNIVPPQMGIDDFQKSLALGRWMMEYRVFKNDSIISKGVFKTSLEGFYDISVEAQNNATLTLRCLGGLSYYSVELSMPVSSPDATVYCPTIHMETK